MILTLNMNKYRLYQKCICHIDCLSIYRCSLSFGNTNRNCSNFTSGAVTASSIPSVSGVQNVSSECVDLIWTTAGGKNMTPVDPVVEFWE